MPPTHLGRLPNAPLAYVIAQVRFDTILGMDRLLPDIQAALRSEYPRFQAVQGLNIVIGPSGPLQSPGQAPPRWDFGTEDNRRGVILQNDSLTYHTTQYTTYDNFEKSLSEVLAKAEQAIPDMFVRRTGLRYIDIIIPGQGETPSQFVEHPLRCDPGQLPGIKSHHGVTVIVCELDRGQLHVKYFITAKSTPPTASLIPPDLEPFPLAPSEIMLRAQSAGHPIGVLDTDRFVQAVDQRYNVDTLIKEFRELHKDITLAFKEFTSEHARKAWSRT